MSSLVRRAGSKLARLIARTADPAAVVGQAQLYAKTVSGTAQLFAEAGDGTVSQLTPVAASSGTVNELWGPRVTPHAADDEFNTNTLNAAWSQTGFTALDFTTRPAPYVNPVATNRASWENLRDPDNSSAAALAQNTWLRTQPAAGLGGIWKRIDSAAFGGAVPAALLAWARFRFSWRNASAPAAADSDIGLSFFEDTGAGFSFAKHATVNLNNTQEGAVANVIKPLFWGRNGASAVNNGEGTRQNNSSNNRSDYAFYSGYVALQKLNATDYAAWVIDDGGRLYMGTYTNAGLAGINAVAIWFRANNGAGGACIFDVDYIRFYQGSDWIP